MFNFVSFGRCDFYLLREFLHGRLTALPERSIAHRDLEGFFEWITSGNVSRFAGKDGLPLAVILTRTSPMVRANRINNQVRRIQGHRVLEIADIHVRDQSSLEAIIEKEAKGEDVILVIRSSLFLVGAAKLALETDRRYRYVLEHLSHPRLKLAAIVYSRTTNDAVRSMNTFSGWPIVLIHELTSSTGSALTLHDMAEGLMSQSFPANEHPNLFEPLVADAIRVIEKDLSSADRTRVSVLVNGIVARSSAAAGLRKRRPDRLPASDVRPQDMGSLVGQTLMSKADLFKLLLRHLGKASQNSPGR
jgi:hypothetical protein